MECEYRRRVRRNPGYSLRAFARDIGMPASKLSEVLRGLRGISKKTAQTVSESIQLSPTDAAVFSNLVDLHQTRSRVAREKAEINLKKLTDGSYDEVSLERFKVISDWYHFAILELSEVEGFESDVGWIAGRLGIATALAKETVERLIEFNLLARSPAGTLTQTLKNLATPTGIPSRDIREHHSQLLMKAESALHDLGVEERDFSATTLAFDFSQIDEIKDEIKDLRRRIGTKIQTRSRKNRAYCLTIQFFPLDQQTSKRKSK